MADINVETEEKIEETEEKVEEEEKTEETKETKEEETEETEEDPEYKVYGKATEEETKNMAEKMFNDVVETLKLKQDDWNKTINDYRTNKPSVDLLEYDDKFVIKMDLPRVTKENVSIKMSADAVDIIVNFPDELAADEEVKVLKKERCCGETKNIVLLPSEVNVNEVKATFTEGLLNLDLPKVKASKVDVEID